jgi:predicted nuclease of predicted toxin-antitoxin system
MKLLTDECCDVALVEALRADGHDVLYVLESLRGALDEEVITCAYSEDRLLITEQRLWRTCIPS